MSIEGVFAVAGAERVKLRAQPKVAALLAACALGPFAFALVMRVQSALPEDTLFGRSVRESGFATPLVVLGFGAFWLFPALAAFVGGDLFAAEDRHRTWAAVLTRSRSRGEVFGGKVLTALGFSCAAVVTLAISSIAAGVLLIGPQPLVDLSGAELSPGVALSRVGLAWASTLPPVFAFTGVAVLISVATRSSAAGVGLPVVLGLLMQLSDFLDGPDLVRRLLITTPFTAWHGLLTERPYVAPLVYGVVVSAAYVVVCLAAAYRLMRRRDVGE